MNILGFRIGTRVGEGLPTRVAGVLAFGLGVAFVFSAASNSTVSQGPVDVGFQDSTITVAPGDTVGVGIVVRGSPRFNAFDASLRFDPAMLSFEPGSETRGELMTAACAQSFHRFQPAPDSLRIVLSLLCSKISVSGPGVVYRVVFRAGRNPGATTLSLGPSTEFYRAGLFVRPLHRREMVVNVAGRPAN